jgi:hypothetical protein
LLSRSPPLALPRPINYSLSLIIPPLGVAIDPRKRPAKVARQRGKPAAAEQATRVTHPKVVMLAARM